MRAKISKGYLARNAFIALFCIGGSLWFIYDGAIGYPAQRERALKYLELQEDDRLDEWEAVARERGWPVANPGEPKTEGEFTAQFIMGGLVAIPGALFAVFFLRNLGRWVEMDETGLRNSEGRELRWEEITTLEKKKWDSKGIAKVRYQRDGRKRSILLDDWKYETQPTRTILREVEAHISPEQIAGGQPEPPLEQPGETAESVEPDDAPIEATGSTEPSDAPEKGE